MARSLHVLLVYVVTHLGLVFFMYPEDIIASADEGHWVPVLTGFAFHFAFLWIYMKGLSRGGGKDLTSLYLDLGKAAAALLLLPVFVYFLMVNIITIRSYSEIITIVFLSNTPLWAIMLLLFLIPAWMASLGIRTIFRATFLVAAVCLPLVLFIFVSSFQNVDWRYVYPLLDKHYTFWSRISFYKSFFAYAGSFLFLGFVQPYFSYRIRTVLWTAVGMLPSFLFSVYVPLLTFGESTASTFFFPYVVTLDIIQINWLMFERITVFFLMSLISFVMLFVALVLWQSSQIVGRFWPRAKTNWIIGGLSVVIFAGCLMVRSWNGVEQLFIWNTWIRWYILIVVPLTVYALGRRAEREAGGDRYAAGR